MTQATSREGKTTPSVNHPLFSWFFNWTNSRGAGWRYTETYRLETVGQARGVVLEVGAGSGLNFALYQPGQVERVEAIEPDATMRRYAEPRRLAAPVPITLTAALAEALPFPDATFDSVVATLVLCSVSDPRRSLAEIRRVLKPGGALLLYEHVRAEGPIASRLQEVITPVMICLAGGCHWNRNTAGAVVQAGFQITNLRHIPGGLHPQIVLFAMRP
ncbi:MAG TPA: class I SAM-dependent methyltransferase [Ktedonobacterales bacterium]